MFHRLIIFTATVGLVFSLSVGAQEDIFDQVAPDRAKGNLFEVRMTKEGGTNPKSKKVATSVLRFQVVGNPVAEMKVDPKNLDVSVEFIAGRGEAPKVVRLERDGNYYYLRHKTDELPSTFTLSVKPAPGKKTEPKAKEEKFRFKLR